MDKGEFIATGIVASIEAVGMIAIQKAVSYLGRNFMKLGPQNIALLIGISIIHGVGVTILLLKDYAKYLGIGKINNRDYPVTTLFGASILCAAGLGVLTQTAAKANLISSGLSVAGVGILTLMYPITIFSALFIVDKFE